MTLMVHHAAASGARLVGWLRRSPSQPRRPRDTAERGTLPPTECRRKRRYLAVRARGLCYGPLAVVALCFAAPVQAAIPVQVLSVGNNPSAMAIDPATDRLFVAGIGPLDPFDQPAGAGSVRVYDSAGTRLLSATTVGLDTVALAADPQTGRLFVADAAERVVRMLDTRTGVVLRVQRVAPAPMAITVDVLAGRVLVLCAGPATSNGTPLGPGSLAILDARTGAVLHSTSIGARPIAMAVDASSGRAFVLDHDRSTTTGTLRMLDIAGGAVLHTVPLRDDPALLAVDETQGRVFIATSGYGGPAVLEAFDGRSGARLTALPLGFGPGLLAIDGLRHRLYAGGSDSLHVYDARTYRPLRIISNVPYPPFLAVDAPVNRVVVATANSNGDTMVVLDRGSGAVLSRVPVRGQIRALVADPHSGTAYALSGVLLASAGQGRLTIVRP